MEELARRRAHLIELCELQRSDIAMHVGALETPLAMADRVFRVARYLRGHPLALGAAVTVVAAMRRRGIWKLGRHAVAKRGVLLKWGQRGLVAWRAWRALRGRRASI